MSNINEILLRNLSTAELKELQLKYPYFAHLQKLLAKRNFNPSAPDFSADELQKAAVITANRDHLKQFLYDIELVFGAAESLHEAEETILAEEQITGNEKNEPIFVADVTEKQNEEHITKSEKLENTFNAESDLAAALAILSDSKKELEAEPDFAETESKTDEQHITDFAAQDKSEEEAGNTSESELLNLKSADEADNSDREYADENKISDVETSLNQPDELKENHLATTAIHHADTSADTPSEPQPFVYVGSETEQDTTVKHTFDEWFLFIEKRKQQAKDALLTDLAQKRKNEDLQPKKDELDDLINQTASLAMFEETLKHETNYAKGLESFITEQKKKKEKVRNTATAPTFVTETYAHLLLKQGKTEKAIETFQQLILKYPEKSSYFADLIEKIKK